MDTTFRVELPERPKAPKSRNEGMTRLLVSTDLGASCRALAKHEGRDIDPILREALVLYLAAHHPEAKVTQSP